MSYIKAETPNAVYFINLESHSKFLDSIPDSQRLDAVFAELSINMPQFAGIYGADSAPAFFDKIAERNFQKRKADVFFVDPGLDPEAALGEVKNFNRKIGSYQLGAALGMFAATPAGAYTVGKLIYSIATKEKGNKISRRTLLKYGAAGALCAFPFAFADFIGSMEDKVPFQKGEISSYRKLGLKFAEFVSKNDTYYIKSARDAVIAERLEGIVAPLVARKSKRKPVIGVYMGAGHGIDLEKMLKDQQIRKQYFEAARQYRPFAERMSSGFFQPRYFRWNESERKFEGPIFFERQSSRNSRSIGQQSKEIAETMSRRAFFKRFFNRRA